MSLHAYVEQQSHKIAVPKMVHNALVIQRTGVRSLSGSVAELETSVSPEGASPYTILEYDT